MDTAALLTRSECKSLLKKYSTTNNEELVSYRLEPLAETPVGFLGNHYRLIINTSKNSSVSFFVKTMPKVKIHSDYIEEIGAFKKETDLFKYLMAELQDIMEPMKAPQWSPKCYLSKDNLLVLEDLSVKNYRLAPGKGMFDLDHCTFALKTLANFHASSIIWEHRSGEKISEKYPEIIKEATYVNEPYHPRSKWLSSAIKALMHLCEKIGRGDDATLIPTIVVKGVKNLHPISGSYNSLCHSDLWSNNFMFNYDHADEITNCILIDYQLARYAPCALDLMCCIHLITTKSMRERCFTQLVEIYEQHLMDLLKAAGIEKKCTSISKDCHRHKIFALIETCLYGITIWLPTSSVEEALGSPSKCFQLIFGNRTPIMETAYEDDFFRAQMTDLLNELLDTYKAMIH